ncbi:MAG TPA: serine hydrolase [Nevskiaceae bacterium]|nr:serine hydrolase [Nevskiaceae bacterium]
MNAPTPSNYQAPSQPTTQNIAQYSDESLLWRSDITDIIKQAVLRYRLSKSVQQAENAQVLPGVRVVDFQTNQVVYDHNQNSVHFAASVNKLPIAWLVLQDLRAGTLQFNQVLTWTAADQRAGAGIYDQPGAPTQATVKDLLFDMLNPSGNTAVRALVNQGMGGAQAVNNRLAQVPQIPNTRLQPLDANRFYVGNTTPKEALFIMQQLLAGQDKYQKYVKNALATNIYTDISVRSQLAGNDFILLVNKVGLLDDPEGNNRHDVGVIYNTKAHKSYGFSLLTTSPFTSTTATSVAEQSLKDMGRATLRYAGDKPGASLQTQTFAAPQPQQPNGRILY